MEPPATSSVRPSPHSVDPAPAPAARRLTLPPELLLLIVEAVAPANPLLIVPPWHPAAQTLLALSRTCRATRGPASRLLRERCMYIESAERLARVVSCLEARATSRWPRGLVPFERSGTSAGLGSAAMCGPPPVAPPERTTALYLAPFARSVEEAGHAVDLARRLLVGACKVRRLIMLMPRDAGVVGEDADRASHVDFATDWLMGGVGESELEELVCLSSGSELGLRHGHCFDDVPLRVSAVQRLVLFEAWLRSGSLWRALAGLPRLRSAVLACPTMRSPSAWVGGIGEGGGVNIKREYLRILREGGGQTGSEMGIRITLVDVAYEMEGLVDTEGWEEVDPEGRVTVRKVELPRVFYGDEGRGEAVTEWVRRAALDGSIWDWEGEPF